MDPQFLINIGFTCAGFFGGWVLNNITKSVTRLEDRIADLPHVYVQKDDYRRDIDEVKIMLRQISEKLDNKADKQ